MSERKPRVKRRGKGEEDEKVPVDKQKPSNVEYKIAKYLKAKLPEKKTKFLNHQVSYFNANKAIDVLLDSQWATGSDPLFTDRQSVAEYGNLLLQHKFFHRAKKIAITDKDLSQKELKKKKEKEKEKEKEKSLKKEEEESKEEKNKEECEEEKGDKKKEKAQKKEKEKKKTKIRLDMHLEQVFVDASDAYVWMYDPIPFWYYFAGALLLCSAVGICLFPLWPPSVRQGVYYLSMAAASFLGLIFSLAIIRFIVFSFIWILSIGRHHFWILPNLTEDVGFFASFWPLYHYEYNGDAYDKKHKSKSKRKKEEEEEEQIEEEESKREEKKKKDVKDRSEGDEEGEHCENISAGETDKQETDGERVSGAHTDNTDSENGNSNSFEMVDKDDVQEESPSENEE